MKHILFNRFGAKYYYENMILYRVIYKSGNEFNYLYKGKFYIWHREDGPATMFNGNKKWYYDGQYIDCRTQEEFEKILKLKAFW